MTSISSKTIALLIICIMIIVGIGLYFIINVEPSKEETESEYADFLNEGFKVIQRNYTFSEPNIKEHNGLVNVYVDEADFNDIHDQWPVLPVNLTTFTFPLGTKIAEVIVTYNDPKNMTITENIAYGSCSTITDTSDEIYQSNEMYPSSFMSYHLGGGLLDDEHTTFLNIRINPVTYSPNKNLVHFIQNATITLIYKEPETVLIQDSEVYDLLIISPQSFVKNLEPLVNHKQDNNIKTRIKTVEEIDSGNTGRDIQEKIKYMIKQEIEQAGIDYVLLVGGIDKQSTRWNLPVRYSHVIIREGTQEIVEPEFISDIYFADIYDSEGNFSSWDTNNNGIYAEYKNGIIDEMDLYPDIAVGRIPCRDAKEVKIMVDKIIVYESQTKNSDWFKNMILISGDHWADEEQVNEGVLIMEAAADIMQGFNPVELYTTTDSTILNRDIRKAINQGAGFAYFCGHGSPKVWGIHLPPDATGWAPTIGKLGLLSFYKTQHMNLLRNRNKLPITMVGGCNNGQFDISRIGSLKQGKITLNEHCWAWHLTIQKRGGAIATIANTGLGTHAMGDADNNNVNDYLEIYDGWLELKFLELYNNHNIDILGITQMDAITQYLNTFLGSSDEMDIKMVQQWQLFGDPSLSIGGI